MALQASHLMYKRFNGLKTGEATCLKRKSKMSGMHRVSTDCTGESLRDISHLAHWTLSSCKQGQGLDQLRDPSLQSYWQSDGPQPHSITLQFPKKMTLQVNEPSLSVRLFSKKKHANENQNLKMKRNSRFTWTLVKTRATRPNNSALKPATV
jgi:hypothetical protein